MSWLTARKKLSRVVLLPIALFVLLLSCSNAVADFGVSSFDGAISNQDGSASMQAGSHPYQFTTKITFNYHTDPVFAPFPVVDGDVRDLFVDLPPGFIGDPGATSRRCNVSDLVAEVCPNGAQVGVAEIIVTTGIVHASVYNLIPPPNSPAEFGFLAVKTPVLLTPRVRSGGDFGITVGSVLTSQSVSLRSTTVTFWGVPADPSHDLQRCLRRDDSFEPPICDDITNDDRSVPHSADGPRVPFFRDPTSCGPVGVGLRTGLRIDSWQNPGVFVGASFFTHLTAPDEETQVGTTGCDVVPFEPSISAQPGSGSAGSPSGWSVGVSIPQDKNPDGLGQADVKKVIVRLPEGVMLNPSAAGGLGSCSSAQVGLVGTSFGEPNPIHFNEAEAACPENSRIGTVVLRTPLLEEPLEGAVYLAAQNDNPFNSLLALYLVVKGPGVLLKLPGLVQADPSTGRLTATFDHNPQLPFSSLKLSFKEGPRAPLINPATCGAFASDAAFSSWAQPEDAVTRTSSFQIANGADGGACAPLGFNPSFEGGTNNPQAGAFSPFILSFSRTDGEQTIRSLTETLPPGVLAKLAGVTLCSDVQANAGSCPDASQIGTVTVGSGAGPDPFFLKGKIYLTGPYNGGPYGETVVVPAVAGPFNLGNVVVRGSIRIDPHTAQATVVSDQFPQFVNQTGIPSDIRRVDVVLDREKFTFNPTNCDPLQMTGTLTSSQGASSPIAAGFHAVNCATLPFHPTFKVSTGAKTSRASGAALHVVVTSGLGQANIRSVHVTLPKVLPSRLTTLQKACPDAVFNANPASCPPESRVGIAKARTPVLANPLSGPAYFVSHGGVKFPDLVTVLQGEGITVELTGHTDIKGSVTSSTFNTVPDVPVTRFDLTLPQGPHSVLTAVANVCKSRLTMPTSMIGQNGATITRKTKIAVSGCPKAKKARRAAGKAGRGGHKGHR
jgi:hypothetical protein